MQRANGRAQGFLFLFQNLKLMPTTGNAKRELELTMHYPAARTGRCLLVLLVALTLGACANFEPQPLEQARIRDRAETQEAHGLRVSVAVLSREESSRVFGVKLHEHGVQPVWLEIENQSAQPLWFMMHGLDPNYFSANEVAYMNHGFMQRSANREMDRYFSELGIDQSIRPGSTVSGFAFSNETIGTKEVRVQLYGNKTLRNFSFFVSVPGIQSEWNQTDFEDLYDAKELVLTETEEQLKTALQNLDCCTSRLDGSGQGPPINAVFINGVATLKALITAGWDETAFNYKFSNLVGSAYFHGRPPDVQFSKSRRKIDSTNLIRLWLSPIRYQGKAVLVASVSRSVDPNVDESLVYLAEDLVTAQTIARWGYVGGVGEVSRDNPRRTFANSPYWTLGNRLVLEMTEQPVEPDKVDMFDWNWKGRHTAKARDPDAR